MTHPYKHFSRSITKNCHRHVHRPPATILHSTTICAIGSQSFILQILFLANFEGKMLLSKRRWTRCTLWTRFSEPPTRRKVRKKGSQNVHPAPKMLTKMKKKTTQICVAVVALIASKKARTPSSTSAAGFSSTGAHPALCFSLRHLQLSRRPGSLFYLFTPVESKPKKPTWCREPSYMHAA